GIELDRLPSWNRLKAHRRRIGPEGGVDDLGEVPVISDQPHGVADRGIDQALAEASGAQGGIERPGQLWADGDPLPGAGVDASELAVRPEAAVGAVHQVQQISDRAPCAADVAALDHEAHGAAQRTPGRVLAHLRNRRWSPGRCRLRKSPPNRSTATPSRWWCRWSCRSTSTRSCSRSSPLWRMAWALTRSPPPPGYPDCSRLPPSRSPAWRRCWPG